jgi:two-component system, OmpR family, sensor histidine kinase BaeS
MTAMIMIPLRWKVTAALVFTSVLGVATAAVLSHRLTLTEFDRLRAEEVTAEFQGWVVGYYQEHATLDGFHAYLLSPDGPRPERPRTQTTTVRQGADGSPAGQVRQLPRGRYLLIDVNGVALTSAAPFRAGEAIPDGVQRKGYSIEVDGVRIGSVVDMDELPQLDLRQQQYITRVDQALFIASVVSGSIALVVGALLATQLTRPLARLTQALATVGADGSHPPIETASRDELGQLVQAFNRMSADLDRSNRLRRQMTADIAHELRSPLAVIYGYLEGLRDGTLNPTPERYEAIYEEAQQLRHLIDDLRTLSLADAGELSLRVETANPSDLLADALRSFAVKAQQQGVRLELDTPGDLPPVKVDRARMMQVLSNLIGNALRYTPESGTITLAASSAGGVVEIRVEDTGKGIPPDRLPNLFQRFYRVEDAREQDAGQTGIGLAIVKALVEMHGGKVRAESAGLGHGTAFCLLLPAAG